ncbi:MAG: energy transducer TonB [Terracidiphilus sp.]
MPTSEAPATDVNEPNEPNGPPQASVVKGPEQESSVLVDDAREAPPTATRGSRWVDYDTHELLEMISELEDERRWARLREGALWALLVHLAILLGLFLLPKYITVPQVVDKTAKLDKDEFTYMDTPRFRPKVEVKPAIKPPVIDKQTLEEMRKESPQAVTPPPETKPQEPAPVQPQPSQPIPPSQQSQVEAPRPAAVPARPNFAMNSSNPADQLREAMRNAARSHGAGEADNSNSRGLAMHPGAGSGGVQVLSDTQGVDFSNWLQRWHWETERTWDPLIPDEVNPPINKSGMVAIEFKVLPNGRLMPDSVHLVGRSGDTALDRAAWGALTGSSYPALPREFHGPYLELRAYFLYNMEPPR